MSKKCFFCERKRWIKKYAPYCSLECRINFESSPERKARLEECKEESK